MKKVVIGILFLLIGFAIGSSFFFWRMNQMLKSDELLIKNGIWNSFPSMDLAANDFQRAYIGRTGLLALQDSEVLYFSTQQDVDGNPLSSKYNYQLIGNNFDTRYWSFTLYNSDHFLIPNEENKYSVNLDNIIYTDSTQSKYIVNIGKTPKGQNWIPSGEGENMSILLRLYNPAEYLYKNKATIKLPELIKIDPS